MKYYFDNSKINLKNGQIFHLGQTHQLRAKTLLVLKALIERQDCIVDKSELLAQIWPDVVVQEQVLVQSIKEIRDILGSDVIKTYPKKGYQWVQTLETSNRNKQHSIYTIIAGAILLAFLALAWFWQQQIDQEQNNQISIAFLPVKNEMQDALHEWVPLKGMDYLSHRLEEQSQLNVLNSDDLVFAMARTRDFDSQSIEQQVYQLRKKLGADIIIQTRLAGFPQDFQIHYTMFSAHNVERGVEFAKTPYLAFDKLIAHIAQRYGNFAPSSINYQSDFSNEAFANGIEFYLKREYQQAITYFTAALNASPTLLSARRYLAASYANSGDLAKSLELLEENIQAAQVAGDKREELRGYLMVGYLIINYDNPDDRANRLQTAEQYLNTGMQLATLYQDKLFIAYTHEELGKVKRIQGKYLQAVPLLKSALEHHKAFRGSYGQTTALIELAKVAAAQHQYEQASHYFAQAHQIADTNQTPSNKVWILLAQADVLLAQDKTSLANEKAVEAKAVAQQAQNDILKNRVNAWFKQHPIYDVN
ncbi:winged helix-turn-helix domain-containing protein [Catenovulum sp. SM1970]|uniref:tetratricopeptide repeat protein n=1 Tax=Marinifaba aquimaris TaxID=2741323 RepID=UPI0015737B5A|nr:tetratricopeptide repeat protein [Marinifaba aquimaris]NTS77931.1 winged helix-turn-helix domain-containing protein [Marinifaba aquimaris]